MRSVKKKREIELLKSQLKWYRIEYHRRDKIYRRELALRTKDIHLYRNVKFRVQDKMNILKSKLKKLGVTL